MPTRRGLLLAGAGATAAGLAAAPRTLHAAETFPGLRARVIVVGGGFAGATCAKYLRAVAPQMRIRLVEPKAGYITCPFSNEVVAGLRALPSLRTTYEALRTAHDITVHHNRAQEIDPVARRVVLDDGTSLPYDRLVLAPGIAFRYGDIEGHSAALAEGEFPHAWNAGPQTTRLRDLVRDMRPGGTVILSVPPAPYRCPPAPYERASLIAHVLKARNPTAKILLLDANDTMPTQPLFEEAWSRLYPGMITRVTKSGGGTVRRLDAAKRAVTADGGTFQGDVINLIVPHQAGFVARQAGLADATGYCPVDPRSFESRLVRAVHVIGDASACGLPKSATSGMAEAKVCAKAVAALLANDRAGDPVFINTCYSVVAPDYAFGLAGVYRLKPDPASGLEVIAAMPEAFGSSPTGQSAAYHKKEAEDARGWYANMVADAYA